LKKPKPFQILAVVAMIATIGVSIPVWLHPPKTPPYEKVMMVIFGTAFWLFLARKIWTRPSWGLGIGIFMCAVIGFQTHLWVRAINDPGRGEMGIDGGVGMFILAELPLALVAVGSFMAWSLDRRSYRALEKQLGVERR
jgi:hypothetical protein